MIGLRRSSKIVGVAWLACGSWLGCNAILGNESAEYDPDAAARLDGAATADGPNADAEGGGDGTDGGPDGPILDGGDAGTPCVDVATNPLHCGSCNHDCRGGGCVDGGCQPIVLATDVPGPSAIAIDSTHLYWLNVVSNDVFSIQLDGGGKKLLYDGPDSGGGQSLAVHGGNVYFASEADLDASVLRCATPACAGGPKVEVANRDVPVSVFVTAAGQLYFSQSVSSGTVERCQLPCTLGTQVLWSGAAQAFPSNVAVGADGALYWTTLNGSPTKLNVQTPSQGGFTSIAGGSITAVTPTTGEVYYMDDGNGPSAVPLDGGPSRRLRTVPTNGSHLALDTTVVYATESLEDFVYACDRKGCGDGGIVLARNQPTPRGIVFDATFIYWANEGNVGTGGQIMRLAR